MKIHITKQKRPQSFKNLTLLCVLLVSFFAHKLIAQVGINTITPDASAMLDISATDRGVLIPRISLTNVADISLDGTNPAAIGLLIYNTNAATSGGSGVGFYSFNGTLWEKLITSATPGLGDDADFFEEGTTNAPDNINDDIYTQGNVAIGKTNADYKLDIEEDASGRGANITMTGTSNSNMFSYYTEINNSGTGLHTGSYNLLTGSASGSQRGTFNGIDVSGDGDHIGMLNNIFGNGNGVHRGVQNNLLGAGSGNQFAINNSIVNSGSGNHYGILNALAGSGDGIQYGTNNSISVTGNGAHYGVRNYLNGSGTGNKYGVYSSIRSSAGGLHYGIFSEALKPASFAGYFLGNVSIGTTILNNYILPTSRGLNNQIMQTDGSGNLSWVDSSSLGVDRINDLFDGKSDNDGSQDGSSVFLGFDAGTNDNSTDNRNVGVGFETLQTNINGFGNTASGYQSLQNNTTGAGNTGSGYRALQNNTIGVWNVANGYLSLFSNTEGVNNTANGTSSLYSNTTGYNNTVSGYETMFSNTIGFDNTASGLQSLYTNTTGNRNSAFGIRALYLNTQGNDNSAIGNRSLYSNTTGTFNTANGSHALYGNTIGNYNTANGYQALISNTQGVHNVGDGSQSLLSNTIGSNNTAVGHRALNRNIDGNFNTAMGSSSLFFNSGGDHNIALGYQSLISNTTGSNNIGIGSNTGASNSTGSNNIFIGHSAGTPETGGYKLYIENSGANADNALIYGEFDNNMLRTNATFQIGNPTGTGYAFPSVDGTNNQIMQTDGAGNVNWVNPTFTPNANNGLSITGSDVILGGNLTQATTITQGNNNLTLDLTGTGDFQIDGNTTNDILFADGGNNVIRFGSQTGNLFNNGALVSGITIDYVADFDNGGSGTTIGVGSAEYITDAGSNRVMLFGSFLPATDDSFDIGSPTQRWDDVYATSGVVNTSDIRLKKNIKTLGYGLTEILKITPISYQWKGQNNAITKLGFSAQELQQILPEVVKTHDVEISETDGIITTTTNEVLGVYYSDIIPVLVKAIQEQQTEMTTLKNENAVLKKKLQAQELRLIKIEQLMNTN